MDGGGRGVEVLAPGAGLSGGEGETPEELLLMATSAAVSAR